MVFAALSSSSLSQEVVKVKEKTARRVNIKVFDRPSTKEIFIIDSFWLIRMVWYEIWTRTGFLLLCLETTPESQQLTTDVQYLIFFLFW
jgi:hypothetical protein